MHNIQTTHSIIHSLEMAGGHIIHIFPPSAFIADVPAGACIPSNAFVYDAKDGKIDIDTLNDLPDAVHYIIHTWNALIAPLSPAGTSYQPNALELEHDLSRRAMHPPPVASTLQSLTTNVLTPGYAETSEFFIGRVAVGIVLPESDGRVDPSTEDWSTEERALVISKITAALDWWATQEPAANLTFVYDDATMTPIPSSYEPISRPYSDQSLWINEVMGKKGYTESSYFDRVRSYNNDMRQIHGTDWAFTIFVVDSSNDADNRFADGYFAYAYLGGPFMVMTYGNNGYGPSNMDAVAAHEIGHIFHALDQYSSAYQPCTRRSGYLGVENQNSQYGDCASDQPSIMRGQVTPYTNEALDAYARGQIGWRDSNGNGLLDPLDTTISLSNIKVVTDGLVSNVLTVTGNLLDEPFPSPLRRSVTINTITGIQYQADGETWIDVPAADGAFDSYSADFTFSTPPIPTGETEILIRATNSAGKVMTHTIANLSVVDPVDEIIQTTLTRLARQGGDDTASTMLYNGQATSEISYIAEMYYRIDDDAWQPLVPDDGVFDEPQETFTLLVDLTALQPGEHRIRAYAVDGVGNVESTPASDYITIAPKRGYVFLPLVMMHP
ncbi:MAG TPA: hypothetical protein ENN19_06335 [Chloroflexi bacterium]|nr:hypothetical protein [Chloroflexota bacterium]